MFDLVWLQKMCCRKILWEMYVLVWVCFRKRKLWWPYSRRMRTLVFITIFMIVLTSQSMFTFLVSSKPFEKHTAAPSNQSSRVSCGRSSGGRIQGGRAKRLFTRRRIRSMCLRRLKTVRLRCLGIWVALTLNIWVGLFPISVLPPLQRFLEFMSWQWRLTRVKIRRRGWCLITWGRPPAINLTKQKHKSQATRKHATTSTSSSWRIYYSVWTNQ